MKSRTATQFIIIFANLSQTTRKPCSKNWSTLRTEASAPLVLLFDEAYPMQETECQEPHKEDRDDRDFLLLQIPWQWKDDTMWWL